MFGEDPHGLYARWAGEGRALIDAARARYRPRSVPAEDGAFDVLKLVAFALIDDGCDLDTLFAEALEAARKDHTVLHNCMARAAADAGRPAPARQPTRRVGGIEVRWTQPTPTRPAELDEVVLRLGPDRLVHQEKMDDHAVWVGLTFRPDDGTVHLHLTAAGGPAPRLTLSWEADDPPAADGPLAVEGDGLPTAAAPGCSTFARLALRSEGGGVGFALWRTGDATAEAEFTDPPTGAVVRVFYRATAAGTLEAHPWAAVQPRP